MTPRRTIFYTLLLSTLIWLAFSWPLAMHLTDAIPSSSRNIEKGQMRDMIPGDHLQLLYHFWLVGDMLSGETPPLYNLYEFNTGDDAARYYPSTYFFPFSLVYAGIAAVGGRALGWNLTGWLSLWLTLLVTWVLVRQFVRDDWIAGCGALVSILVPFRWVMLLGGSPAGFGMLWIPVVLLGLVWAIRDGSWSGSWLAGIGLLLACWGDVQSFFFLVLLLPAWSLWVAFTSVEFRWETKALRSLMVRLLPVPVFVALAFGYRSYFSSHMSDNLMEKGRSLAEVRGFSPHVKGLFTWAFAGVHNHIYIGVVLVLITGLGLLAVSARGRTDGLRIAHRVWAYLALVAAVLVCIVLALGVNGPMEGAALDVVRKMIPPYAMVRQPARIFVLIPSLLALTTGLGLSSWLATRSGSFRNVALTLVACLLILEMKVQVRATLSGLADRQGAYEAVAVDAAAQGLDPHVLVVPIWSGQSDLSATYQHYASLYRVRMVNGYSPVVTRDYFDHVFRKLDSVNQGWLSEEQIDRLRAMGVGHIILHEDAFPEKVSPFPVGFTLAGLRQHPWLELLKQEGPVWAFRIRKNPIPVEDNEEYASLFPTRRYEAEHLAGQGLVAQRVESASGGMCVTLADSGDRLQTRALRVVEAPSLGWSIRARGYGTVIATCETNTQAFAAQTLTFSSDAWSWVPVDVSGFSGYGPIDLRLDWERGSVDLDFLHLATSRWPDLVEGHTLALPASEFFHAGHSTPDSESVFLEKKRDHHGYIFYGPHLPFPKGTYGVRLVFDSDAEVGRWVGSLRVRSRRGTESVVDVLSGRSAALTFTQPENLPVRIEFRYGRESDVELKQVNITRVN